MRRSMGEEVEDVRIGRVCTYASGPLEGKAMLSATLWHIITFLRVFTITRFGENPSKLEGGNKVRVHHRVEQTSGPVMSTQRHVDGVANRCVRQRLLVQVSNRAPEMGLTEDTTMTCHLFGGAVCRKGTFTHVSPQEDRRATNRRWLAHFSLFFQHKVVKISHLEPMFARSPILAAQKVQGRGANATGAAAYHRPPFSVMLVK